MSKPRKPTQQLRRIIDEQLKTILGPEDGAVSGPAATWRRVQVLVPASPGVFLTLDRPTPLEAGPNRTYNMPPLTPNTMITFVLQPEQTLYACVDEGFAVLGLIVEYLED